MTKKRLGRGLAAIYGDEVVKEVENDRKTAQQAAKEKEAMSGEEAGSDAVTTKKTRTGRSGSAKTSSTGAARRSTAKAGSSDEKGREIYVRMARIIPKESQPRQNFDEEGLEELAGSIKQHGVIQPLIVQKKGEYYEIVSGERRWRAARMAGLKELPVLVRDYSEQESAEISLIENLQREDLNPIEEALAYRRLMDEFGLKQDEIADRVAKNRTTITNSLRLLKLSPEVQQMVADGIISGGHARALLGIRSAAKQTAMAHKVAEGQMSVRETEAAVNRMSAEGGKKTARKKGPEDDALALAYEELAERLASALSSKVSIKRRNKEKGSIEIEYGSQEELERIADLLESVRP